MPTKTAPLAVLDPEKIPLEAKILALCGPAAQVHPLVLQSLLVRAARGDHLGIIIGDNRLDEYALARLARAHGFDPAPLLARLAFSRPFTCHQLHHGVLNLATERAGAWSALYVLGLLETFWDEDIRSGEAIRLLNEILIGLRDIAARGLSVLVTMSPPPAETSRQNFVARVLAAADAYWLPALSAPEHLPARQMELW